MTKKLVCDRCKKELGEIIKGKIKKDAILLCGRCNYDLLMLENKSDKPNDLFNVLFGGA